MTMLSVRLPDDAYDALDLLAAMESRPTRDQARKFILDGLQAAGLVAPDEEGRWIRTKNTATELASKGTSAAVIER
jgi:predicted transcriptional regulator